ncbi:MAG: septal ring lytic transglycosylase RlpA family protein [Desulfoplanes sp.]
MLIILCAVVLCVACAKQSIPSDPVSPYEDSYSVYGKRYHPRQQALGYQDTGLASWSGKQGQGRVTASGEKYDFRAMTCAHKTLPFDTVLRVINLSNNKMVLVRVNDRGPFKHGDGRIIDLSWNAAKKLGMLAQGVTKVRVEAVK